MRDIPPSPPYLGHGYGEQSLPFTHGRFPVESPATSFDLPVGTAVDAAPRIRCHSMRRQISDAMSTPVVMSAQLQSAETMNPTRFATDAAVVTVDRSDPIGCLIISSCGRSRRPPAAPGVSKAPLVVDVAAAKARA